MMSDFTDIPILDYALVESGERVKFIAQLRHAFVNVGFCYLKNPSVNQADVEALVRYTPRLFEMEQTEKDRIRMVNSPHFLGYNRLGSELTRGSVDLREQFDFATPYKSNWKPGDPDHQRLPGEPQWPNEDVLPGFKETFLRYLTQVESLGFSFTKLLAEALELPPPGFDYYFGDRKEGLQHRCKIVKYPVVDPVKGNQGVGPHFDGGFLTFLLQASSHECLQVQNLAGQWISVKPLDNTLVVNIGKALEAMTKGVARATSHRVLSPTGDSGPRYSIPFFLNLREDIRLRDHILPLSPEIHALKEKRGADGPTDSVNYPEYANQLAGVAALIARIKSHPDVGQRHYPELSREIFGTDEPVRFGSY